MANLLVSCPFCADTIPLEEKTYGNFAGNILCIWCRSELKLIIKGGHLVTNPLIVRRGRLPKRIEVSSFDHQSVPGPIVDDFDEALRCREQGSYKACVVMCRRVLESTTMEKGAKGRTLHDKISDLSRKGLIPNQISEIATEIRAIGNYGAHPGDDRLSNVDQDEAESLLDLTRHIVEYVFIMPHKLSELKKKRS